MKLDGDKGVVAHFLLDCQVKSRTKLTLVNYQHHLKTLLYLLEHLCGVTELEQVTIKHLRECVQHLLTQPVTSWTGRKPLNGETLSVSTVRGYVRVWVVFFNWCYQEELIDDNPVSRLRLPNPEKRVKPTLTPEQIQIMLESRDLSTEVGFRDYVILLLLLDTGIRLAEIAGLRVKDVHGDYIKVFGKGRKEREIGLHPEVSNLLWKYINKYRRPKRENEAALFLGYGEPLHIDGISGIIKRIKKSCGFEGVRLSPHVFRHTFAKIYMEQGGDVLSLSREMGHSDIQVTRIDLEDFSSSDAKKHHKPYSPVNTISLPKRSKRGGKERRSKKKPDG